MAKRKILGKLNNISKKSYLDTCDGKIRFLKGMLAQSKRRLKREIKDVAYCEMKIKHFKDKRKEILALKTL